MEMNVVTTSVSYMEIYKDEVYDLLVDRDNVRLFSKLWQFDNHPRTFGLPRMSWLENFSANNWCILLWYMLGTKATGARERCRQGVRCEPLLCAYRFD